jgi:hypothetical protein
MSDYHRKVSLIHKNRVNHKSRVNHPFYALALYCLIVIPMSACIDLHNPFAIQHGERSIGHEEKARSEVSPNQTDPGSCQKEGGL